LIANKAALFLSQYDAAVAENSQVMRNLDDFALQSDG